MFSKFDLGSGDHKVRVKDENVHKTNFRTRFLLVILDGIRIYSKNEEEHAEHLRLTLNCSGSISCMQV